MTEPAPPARRSRTQARRARILEAARGQFIENGLGGATTRDIARSAEIPESSMFRHFSSKEKLFEEAIAAHLEEILRSARGDDVSVILGAPSASARLTALEDTHRHYLRVVQQALPVLGAAMFSERELGRGIYRARVRPLLEALGGESVRAMAGWANERADPHMMIFLAFGGYLLLSLEDYFGDGRTDLDGDSARLARLIQYGVRGGQPSCSAAGASMRDGDAAPGDIAPLPGPTRAARVRRERSDAIANRSRLLDAAREEFSARGFGGATTREIARSAGTTESALYRHFSSKEQLFHEAVAVRLQQIITAGLQAVETELGHPRTDAERLEVLRRQHLHYLEVIEQTAPLLGAALFSERRSGVQFYRSVVRPFLDRMTDATQRALQPWADVDADAGMLITVAVGGYLLISFDAYFRESVIDHDAVADKITWLLYYGVAGLRDDGGPGGRAAAQATFPGE